MDELSYIHTIEFYSVIKKEWTTDVCKLVDEFHKHTKWKKHNKRAHAEQFHLYKVKEQDTLIYCDKYLNSSCLWW